MGRGFAVAAATFVIALPATASGQALEEFEGAIHEHTAYSDGEPGTRPSDAFAAVRDRGSDFMALTDHSDAFALPIVVSTDCLGARLLECLIADRQRPGDSFRKWQAMREQTDAATTDDFVGIRGFEWTNDRHGHINVLFSQNHTNAKIDGGYLAMGFFWSWFTRPAALGGGGDGLAIFNHPGRRELGELVPGGFISPYLPDDLTVPGGDWDAFRHVPAADPRMVGMELFNGGSDYGDADRLHPAGSYGEALDKGWHVGAIGAEDIHDTGWGVPDAPKTVILAPELTRAALRDALAARRFYAVRNAGVRLSFTADGEPMGARLERAAGVPIRLEASAAGATLELVTSGGAVVASGAGTIDVTRPASGSERWYFVRALDPEGRAIAYSSPVWIELG
jgi:hypothetical protein